MLGTGSGSQEVKYDMELTWRGTEVRRCNNRTSATKSTALDKIRNVQ